VPEPGGGEDDPGLGKFPGGAGLAPGRAGGGVFCPDPTQPAKATPSDMPISQRLRATGTIPTQGTKKYLRSKRTLRAYSLESPPGQENLSRSLKSSKRAGAEPRKGVSTVNVCRFCVARGRSPGRVAPEPCCPPNRWEGRPNSHDDASAQSMLIPPRVSGSPIGSPIPGCSE